MLLEFRVRNYRSFGEEQTLSLVASLNQELLASNTILSKGKPVFRTVRSAVIYGANASGKSNLIRSIQLMRGVVLESVLLRPDQPYNVQTFQLSNTLKDNPSLFEVTVLLNGIRYQYGFEFTTNRITSEWLLVYEKSKPQRWIDRQFDKSTQQENFVFSNHLVGQKKSWQEATRPNALFLSTAVQLNSEQLRPLYNWFAESLVVFMDGAQIGPNFTTARVRDPIEHSAIRSMINSADIAISNIAAVPQKGIKQQFKFDLASGQSESKKEDTEFLIPQFTHVVGDVTAKFNFHDESLGTQKLFSLAGPFLDILEKGKVLVIDELDGSLHPLLVRQIINMFQDPLVNKNNAQLIFSTHDTSLLDNQLFRRDQIWFVDKGVDQASKLVSLSDFSPRLNEAFAKGYLSGRYGGIPILDQLIHPSNSDG